MIGTFEFTKMNGAGNDFIFCSGRCGADLTSGEIALLCDRKRGIGADGLIRIDKLPEDRLQMKYFNSDGSPADMCGNGLRCAMEYAAREGMAGTRAVFQTGAGILRAERLKPEWIRIEMPHPEAFQVFRIGEFTCSRTRVGVPHVIVPVSALEGMDVAETGRRLRYAAEFAPEGANIDFVEAESPDRLSIRTYERGVEAETLACGTGITAAAAWLEHTYGGEKIKQIKTRGNDLLTVEFGKECNILKEVFLTGPAEAVFHGVWEKTDSCDF